jgi:4-hydroxy-L-threonine phosphate dehydrogenase PdxA
MYHDQGLPVLKYSWLRAGDQHHAGPAHYPHFSGSRHGRWISPAPARADWHSLEQAIEIACQMSLNRQR